MKTYNECIPCFAEQAYRAVSAFEATNEEEQGRLLRKTLRLLAEQDFSNTPPFMAQQIYRFLREETSIRDPYRQEKISSNKMMLKLLPEMKKRTRAASDPLEYALRLAIAGNIIDFGIGTWQEGIEIEDVISHALESNICMDSFNAFRERVKSSANILYLGDNSGEIVMDRILIEEIGAHKVTFAVRGQPILNDVTLQEAEETGITKLTRTVENGSDAPGTILRDCSPGFQKRFRQADMVISKGQGNYETLSDCPREIFFLLKVKCPVVAKTTGHPQGSVMLYHKPAGANRS